MKSSFFLRGAIIPLFFIHLVLSQESERTLFNKGLDAYQTGRYELAQNQFLKILQLYPRGKLSTITKLLLGKTYYKQGDYSAVGIISKNFFSKHPGSMYIDDMHHLYANALFRQGRYSKAVEHWLWVINHSKDPRLKKMDGEYVFKTMDAYLNQREIQRLQIKFRDETFQGLVTIVRAKKFFERKQDAAAISLLEDFLKKNPNHIYADEARRLLSHRSISLAPKNAFVYLKSVQEDLAPMAEHMEDGMRYAIFEYQARNKGVTVPFQVEEVGESVLDAVQVALQTLRFGSPLCLIGPIDPDQCSAVSLLSRYERTPHIAPLSSQNGLTQISPFTFQINPDVETKARYLGEYAVRELGLYRFAVLAPVSQYGKAFVQGFIEAVQANGGEVVTDQWYYEDTQDFTRQFKAIRRKGFWVSFQDSIMQVDSTLSQDTLKVKFQEYLERIFGESRFGTRIDSTQVPSTGIEGLLIITTPDYIPYIAPQFAFHNIQSTLLGNEGWNDAEQLRKYKEYLDGLVYITAAYYDPDSWNYKEFVSRFRLKMKETPDVYHLLGYDIMKWVLSNYRPGIDAEELNSRLARAKLYQGVLEDIEFSDKPRVNTHLTVLKFSLGQIVRLN